jgi:hypothetical protein
MGRSKKTTPYSVRIITVSSEWAVMLRRAATRVTVAALVVVVLSASVFGMKRYVERDVALPKAPPVVVLKNRPAWMTDFLAQQIAASVRPAGLHSAFDHQMLVDRVAMLKTNPWIRNVRQVKRVYGKKAADTLEIDCDYRAPIALVKWQRDYWLVDADGVKLPEKFAAADVPKIVIGKDGHTNIRIVDGVQRPPPQPGRPWGGEDLIAGLEMVRRLYGLPYADQIVKVTVANFGGRVDYREAQLVLGTKFGKEIRWGAPIGAKSFEVRPEQKFEYLRRVYEEFGRADAGQEWIDIRYDKITYPADAPQTGTGATAARPAGASTARADVSR